jgi:hypothetical protein
MKSMKRIVVHVTNSMYLLIHTVLGPKMATSEYVKQLYLLAPPPQPSHRAVRKVILFTYSDPHPHPPSIEPFLQNNFINQQYHHV